MLRPLPIPTLLSGVFTQGAMPTETPVVNALAGFDAVVQFSRGLMQAQVGLSLRQAGLGALDALVPYGSVPVPPALLAGLSPFFRNTLFTRPAFLEVRLLNPYIAGLHWPARIWTSPEDPVANALLAVIVGVQRVVQVGWNLEINIALPQPGRTQATQAAAPAIAGVSGGISSGNSSGSASAGSSTSSGQRGGNYDRVLLGSGQAITTAIAKPFVSSEFWSVGVTLDFSATAVTAAPDTDADTAFIMSQPGQTMLAQAIAPLRPSTGIRLVPDVMPAGALSAVQVQSAKLPALQLTDLLLTDVRRSPILAPSPILVLCLELGSARGGVPNLVQPLLSGEDFAYATSTELLRPALNARWEVDTRGLTIVSEVPIELPVGNNSDQTQKGTAQVSVTFGDTLDDVTIEAGIDPRGDPLRLKTSQTVQLLNLWQQNGQQITNLGSLATPQQYALLLPLYFFDTSTAAEQIPAAFKTLLEGVIGTVAFPVAPPAVVSPKGATGFTSSPLQTMLIGWSLKATEGGGIVVSGGNTQLEGAR